jgi:hypothetical protein
MFVFVEPASAGIFPIPTRNMAIPGENGASEPIPARKTAVPVQAR